MNVNENLFSDVMYDVKNLLEHLDNLKSGVDLFGKIVEAQV